MLNSNNSNKRGIEKDSDLPNVSIVVIGHNEAKNLDKCFTAIFNMNYPRIKIEVLFIDSHSNDNSVEIAQKYTDKVFQLKSDWPTAGEAFNKGIVESSNDIVHITSGDIQLHPEYLKKAINTLTGRKDIHCTTGYFVESKMKGWNKIMAFRREDDVDVGDHFVATPNGGTFKKEALINVNGYDERIRKGQETELGKRFNDAGLRIWFMNIPQGIHDFELTTSLAMLKRCYWDGYSLGHSLMLSAYEKSNIHLRDFGKSGIKRLLDSGMMLCLLLVLIFFYGPVSLLPWMAIYLIYYAIRVYIKQRNRKRNYMIYQLVMSYLSLFLFFGMMGFFIFSLKKRIKGIRLYHSRIGLKI